MRMTHRTLALLSALAIACSSSNEEPAGEATTCSPTLPSKEELTATKARFSTDVAPIFTQSCAFAACHAAGGKRLVLAGAGARANLLAASTVSPMKMVVPGDPAASFLMHKLDGTQSCAECNGKDCGESMPKGADLLPAAKRDAIRRWIAQGANDD